MPIIRRLHACVRYIRKFSVQRLRDDAMTDRCSSWLLQTECHARASRAHERPTEPAQRQHQLTRACRLYRRLPGRPSVQPLHTYHSPPSSSSSSSRSRYSRLCRSRAAGAEEKSRSSATLHELPDGSPAVGPSRPGAAANAQFTPAAGRDKTQDSAVCVVSGGVNRVSRHRLAKSEQLVDRSPSSRGV